MGVDRTFGGACVRAMRGANQRMPTPGKAFLSVRDADKASLPPIARNLLKRRGYTPGRHRRHLRLPALPGFRVRARQQGGRGPPAHRGRDQEQRHPFHHQHHRGCARPSRIPSRSAARRCSRGCRTRPPRRGAGRPCKPWTTRTIELGPQPAVTAPGNGFMKRASADPRGRRAPARGTRAPEKDRAACHHCCHCRGPRAR